MANKYMQNFISMNTSNPNNIVSSAGSIMVRHAMFAASKVIVDMAIHSRMPNGTEPTAQQEIDDKWKLLDKFEGVYDKKISENATMRPNLSYDDRDAIREFGKDTMNLYKRNLQQQQRELNNYNNRGLINVKKKGMLSRGGILSKERRR